MATVSHTTMSGLDLPRVTSIDTALPYFPWKYPNNRSWYGCSRFAFLTGSKASMLATRSRRCSGRSFVAARRLKMSRALPIPGRRFYRSERCRLRGPCPTNACGPCWVLLTWLQPIEIAPWRANVRMKCEGREARGPARYQAHDEKANAHVIVELFENRTRVHPASNALASAVSGMSGPSTVTV